MSAHNTHEDLRSRKTERALFAAMFSLLKKTSFRKITIKGICEEAFISRAAFYAHFIDKYDLLKHWMTELWPHIISAGDSYDEVEGTVNAFVQQNNAILKNLFNEADNETFGIVFDFLLSTIGLNLEKGDGRNVYMKNVALANFYAGGISSYIQWQIKNRFPADVPVMNRYFYEILRELRSWQLKQGLDIGGNL